VGLRQNQVYLAALGGTGGRRLRHSSTFSTAAIAPRGVLVNFPTRRFFPKTYTTLIESETLTSHST
jgi:hypothetical protein